MAQITGLTKARMLAIEAASVVAGIIQGDNLILTKKDGTTIDAGNVRGPKGDPGPAGGMTSSPAGGDLAGNYPNPTLKSSLSQALIPTGGVLQFAGTAAPAGFLFAQGQAVSRTTYAALFAVLGTTSGVGDGSTTFNLPDLRDRGAVGASGTKALGSTGGSATKVISSDNLPPHTHVITMRESTTSGGPQNIAATGSGVAATRSVSTTDGGFANTPLDTQDPYLALNFIIKT